MKPTEQKGLSNLTDLGRFLQKVCIPQDTNKCWMWTGALLSGPNAGYGQFWCDGGHVPAHRYAYTVMIGPIPPGLVIDHLCRMRSCVNPLHLDAVTHRENILRGEGIAASNAVKTHCKRGHPFTDANTYVRPDGKGRSCKRCQVFHQRAYRERKEAQ